MNIEYDEDIYEKLSSSFMMTTSRTINTASTYSASAMNAASSLASTDVISFASFVVDTANQLIASTENVTAICFPIFKLISSIWLRIIVLSLLFVLALQLQWL